VWNSQGGIGDLAIAGEPLKIGRILCFEAAEDETSRAKCWRGAHDRHYEA
jgi:hypothetical protein